MAPAVTLSVPMLTVPATVWVVPLSSSLFARSVVRLVTLLCGIAPSATVVGSPAGPVAPVAPVGPVAPAAPVSPFNP